MSMQRSVLLLALAFGMLLGCNSVGYLTAPLENHLVYQPSGPAPADLETPHLNREDVWFESQDGVQLHGWYCPAKNPRGVVLFAHGNGGNVADRWEHLRLLANRLEVTVLGFDYRGYGKSEGQPSEAGVIADARAARAFLAGKTQIPESEVILYGQSLGGAVMVDLASKDGARALILESTFTSLADVANYKFPLTPPGKILRNEFNSLAKINQFRGPLLILHGDADQLVPIDQARRLYDAANDPKSFVTVQQGGHNWTPTLDVIAAVDQFLRNLSRPTHTDSPKVVGGVNS
jgi:uncharacterized protein